MSGRHTRTTRHALLTALAALAIVAGCEREPDLNSLEPERTYAPALNVDLDRMTRAPSGLRYEDVRAGEGDVVQQGDAVLVHYTGWLPDGTQFDSSRPRGEPLSVVIGRGEVIRGWDEGVPGMRVGGQRRLVIPPGLAYGATGAGGVIPPGATLVFDVEVVEITSR